MGRRLHLAEQRVHFRRVEAAAGAHAAMAGERAADLLEPLAQRQRRSPFGELVGKVADQPDQVGLAEQRRRLAHHHGAGAERLQHQAELGQLVRPRREARHRRFLELDHLGDQQALAGDAAIAERPLHPLIDQPLVGGVLVDDDDPVGGLGDDVGLVQLSPGGAERIGPLRRGIVVGRRRHRALEGGALLGEAGRRQRREARHRLAQQPGRGKARALAAARAEAGQRSAGDGRRGAVAGGAERMAGGADDQPAHQCSVAEAHLGLGRVDVDVDQLGRQLEKQRHHGMAVAGEKILIGAAHRALQQAVAHRPAIDEEELPGGGRAMEGRQADIAGEANALARRVDRQRVVGKVAAEDGGQPGEARRGRIGARHQVGGGRVEPQQRARFVGQRESHQRLGHRQAPHRLLGMGELGPGHLEELEPGRGGEEQVAQLDPTLISMVAVGRPQGVQATLPVAKAGG